jgi:hypothetical protein
MKPISFIFSVYTVIAVITLPSDLLAQERFTLITPEEAQASRARPMPLVPRSVRNPSAPVIEVVSPDIRTPVAAPIPIRLRFKTEAPSEPKIESFKALYGSFRIDITDRLKKRAVLTKNGLELNGADIPSGRHQIVLSLEDTQGRKSEQTLSFEVE